MPRAGRTGISPIPEFVQPTAPSGQSASSSLPPLPTGGDALLVVLGFGILASGVWLLVRARKTPVGENCQPPLPLVGAVRRSTLFTLALAVMVSGYHIAAWTAPRWLGLHIPGHRWYFLVLGVILAIAGSLWAERIERRERP